MDGYINEYIDVIRYIDDDMVVIENVEVLVYRKSEDDNEVLDMIIPESSKDYINDELKKYEDGYLISEYCIENYNEDIKEDIKAYS